MSKTTAVLMPDNVHYRINGKLYVRVSRVLDIAPKKGLDDWRKRIGEENAEDIMNTMADMGGKVHDVTMHSDRGDRKAMNAMINADPWLIPFLASWDEWVRNYVKKWVAIEHVVWSDKYMVAGRTDRIAVIHGDNQPSTIDIKTGGLWEEFGLQLALYKKFHNERERTKIQRTLVVGWNYDRVPPGTCSVSEYIKVRTNPGNIRVKEYTSKNSEKEAIKIVKEYNRMFRERG